METDSTSLVCLVFAAMVLMTGRRQQHFKDARSTQGSSILLLLPDEIPRAIFADWLHIRDVLQLDSTFCSRVHRPAYAALAYGNNMVLFSLMKTNRYSRQKKFNSIVLWTALRGVRLDWMDLTASLAQNATLRSAFLTLNGQTIKSVKLHAMHEQQYRDISLCVMESCPNIVELDIIAYLMASDEVTEQQIHSGVAQAVAKCAKLQSLSIWFWNITLSVRLYCPSLKSLSLTGSDLNDGTLIALGESCPNLEKFHFAPLLGRTVSYHLTDAGLRALMQGCTLLRDTNICQLTRMQPDLQIELARRARYKELNLNARNKMTTELLEAILRVSPSLEVFNGAGQPCVNDAILMVCAEHCPQLEHIAINQWNSPALTADGVCAFLSQAGARLRHFDISSDWDRSDDIVGAVAEHCPLLVEFLSPRNVSTEAIVQLGQGCPKLSRVSLGCSAANDAAVGVLAILCRELVYLNLKGCPITIRSIELLRDHCKSLKHVVLPGIHWDGDIPIAVQQLMVRGVMVEVHGRPLPSCQPPAPPASPEAPSDAGCCIN